MLRRTCSQMHHLCYGQRRLLCRGFKLGANKFVPRDILPVPIKVITVGKGNSRAAEDMAEEWQSKVARYTKVASDNIKSNPKNDSSPDAQMAAEAAKVLKAPGSRDFVVVLDERGQQCTSHDMASIVAHAGDISASSVTFCIGGPFGHHADVRERADIVVSLSKCVLNHQVARVMLLEQLYRAWTITRGEPYHH